MNVTTFSLAHDLHTLESALCKHPRTRLIIIDPLSAYLVGTDSHRDADVRAVLAPLAEIAARYRVAIIAVMHLNKSEGGATRRLMGSVAFSAASRSVLLVAADPHDPSRRLFLPAKNNLAPFAGGLAFNFQSRANGEHNARRLTWINAAVAIFD